MACLTPPSSDLCVHKLTGSYQILFVSGCLMLKQAAALGTQCVISFLLLWLHPWQKALLFGWLEHTITGTDDSKGIRLVPGLNQN